jgi:hypothetical protein
MVLQRRQMGEGSFLAGPEQSEVGPDGLKVLRSRDWKQAPKCARQSSLQQFRNGGLRRA